MRVRAAPLGQQGRTRHPSRVRLLLLPATKENRREGVDNREGSRRVSKQQRDTTRRTTKRREQQGSIHGQASRAARRTRSLTSPSDNLSPRPRGATGPRDDVNGPKCRPLVRVSERAVPRNSPRRPATVATRPSYRGPGVRIPASHSGAHNGQPRKNNVEEQNKIIRSIAGFSVSWSSGNGTSTWHHALVEKRHAGRYGHYFVEVWKDGTLQHEFDYRQETAAIAAWAHEMPRAMVVEKAAEIARLYEQVQ